MKKCNKCLEEKDEKSYDKYRSTCRKCRNEKNTSSWLVNNYEKRKDYQREYQKDKRKSDPYYRLYCECLWDIKSKIKSKSDNSLREHLENLFDENMNWDNYGSYWEVDHIISAIKMAKYGYSKEEINKYSNIRPLIVKENRERRKLE